ncbi:MAG: hypothetical protein J6567_11120, partial [Gilliamella sp.]
GGLNSYQYAGSDPINWIDPLGLVKVENSGFEGVTGKKATTSESIPNIKGTQVGLRDPASVDRLKNDMLSGNFNFEADFGRIGGYIDNKGNYYVGAGHHRMVAAMEIYKETGDASYIRKLIKNGRWTPIDKPPVDMRPLPKRKN